MQSQISTGEQGEGRRVESQISTREQGKGRRAEAQIPAGEQGKDRRIQAPVPRAQTKGKTREGETSWPGNRMPMGALSGAGLR